MKCKQKLTGYIFYNDMQTKIKSLYLISCPKNESLRLI